MTEHKRHVALVGVGTIGCGWAAVFARAGYGVRLFDAGPGRTEIALQVIRSALQEIAELAGSPSGFSGWLEAVQPCDSLEEALSGAVYVQESVVEDRAIKSALFCSIGALAESTCVLASSCSSLPPEEFLGAVPGRHRCLIVHPFNPPYLIPVVEVVPASFTSDKVVQQCTTLMQSLGQIPILIRKPIPGFVGNRLQAAVVNEAMSLIARGIVSPGDLDTCLRWGLGQRWALMGPFETMDLNAAGGFSEYAAKFGESYQALGRDLRVADAWSTLALEAIAKWRRKVLPASELPERMKWRDRLLHSLRQLHQTRSL